MINRAYWAPQFEEARQRGFPNTGAGENHKPPKALHSVDDGFSVKNTV